MNMREVIVPILQTNLPARQHEALFYCVLMVEPSPCRFNSITGLQLSDCKHLASSVTQFVAYKSCLMINMVIYYAFPSQGAVNFHYSDGKQAPLLKGIERSGLIKCSIVSF